MMTVAKVGPASPAMITPPSGGSTGGGSAQAARKSETPRKTARATRKAYDRTPKEAMGLVVDLT